MMTKIKKEVEKLVQKELDLASEQHGDHFNSNHEAYGVVKEEFEEAEAEFNSMGLYLEYIWQWTKNDWKEVEKHHKQLKERAILAACECIQVAAMAEKATRQYEVER